MSALNSLKFRYRIFSLPIFPKNSKGQTTIEYLMLLLVAFLTTYLVISKTGGLTETTLNTVRSGLQNTVRNGEWATTELQTGENGHPGDPNRLKAKHF